MGAGGQPGLWDGGQGAHTVWGTTEPLPVFVVLGIKPGPLQARQALLLNYTPSPEPHFKFQLFLLFAG